MSKKSFNLFYFFLFSFILFLGCSGSEISDDEAVALDRSSIFIKYQTADSAESVTADLSLPLEGDHGSTILWQSDHQDVISPTGKLLERPGSSADDLWVTLTAIIKKGDFKNTKEFKVLVKKLKLLTLTFNSEGGEAIDAITVDETKNAIKPADPQKNGYGFAGWFTDEALTQKFEFSESVNSSLSLRAKWTANTDFETAVVGDHLQIVKYNGHDKNVGVPQKIGEMAVEEIKAFAFANDESHDNAAVAEITSINLPETITTIGDDVFSGCTKLEKMDLPDNISSIGKDTFKKCQSLKKIHLPENLTTLNDCFFEECCHLESVTLPAKVVKVNKSVFKCCANLRSLIARNLVPPDLDLTAFENVPANCQIKVPPASVNAYKNKAGWNSRADYISALAD